MIVTWGHKRHYPRSDLLQTTFGHTSYRRSNTTYNQLFLTPVIFSYDVCHIVLFNYMFGFILLIAARYFQLLSNRLCMHIYMHSEVLYNLFFMSRYWRVTFASLSNFYLRHGTSTSRAFLYIFNLPSYRTAPCLFVCPTGSKWGGPMT